MNARFLCPLLCIALLWLSGCESILLQDTATQVINTPAALVEATSAEPSEVLSSYMTAWNNQDYDAMYRLLANQSRDLFSQQEFINQYTAAQSKIRITAVSYSANSIDFQGSTAIINYSITFESSTFGNLADENRTMRMIDEGGWKIAWSPMDIFDGMSARARLTERTVFPPRANIYDRNGRLLAEENGEVYSLYVVEQDMRSVDDCLQTLALVTRQQTSTLARIFADYLAETRFQIAEIDRERYERFREALNFDCGIFPSDDPFSKVRVYNSRSYYGHGIATHQVGYIGTVPLDQLERWEARGYSANDLIGRAGIELAYEETLAGQPQRYLRIVESGGTVIRELGGATGEAPRSVTLTIDRELQEITAQTMADAVNYAIPNWGGITAGGAIVAMEVDSGRILAMASYPSFDPHIFNPDTEYNVVSAVNRLNADIRTPFVNKALAEQYTPGSVYKIVTTLAAATEKVWPRDQIFNCEYIWRGGQFGDSEPFRSDWRLLEDNRDPTGEVIMSQALAASCNPFFYQMGALLYQKGADLQANYAQQLGFGSPTGLRGLGIEAGGDVAFPGEPAAAINNAIGQGDVAVTVLQMAQLTALIANGGQLWKPYVVSHIGVDGEEGYESVNQPTLITEFDLDAEALEIAREGMCMVTTIRDLGTAWFVFDDASYRLCGKTGTAETLGNPHAWFVAYYPAENPKFAFAGVMAHSREGSEVVAPMIRRIIDDYEGFPRDDFPEWWQDPYSALKTQQQALAEYLADN